MSNHTRGTKSSSKKRPGTQVVSEFMSEEELEMLGEGEVGYVVVLTYKQARKMFPTVEGLRRGATLFSLHGADGTPIALTDTMNAVMRHAIEDDLAIVWLH